MTNIKISDQKKAHYRSHDAFQNPNIQNVGSMQKMDPATRKAAMRMMFFSTSTADQYKPRDATGAIGANVKGVHGPNAGSESYTASKAPLATREGCCRYHQDFGSIKPLNGVQINKECYELAKEKSLSTSIKPITALKQQGITETHEVFQEYDVDVMKSAIPPNFKPTIQQHVNTEQKFPDAKTRTAEVHRDIDKAGRKMAVTHNFKPKIGTHYSLQPFKGTATTGRQFKVDFKAKHPRKIANQLDMVRTQVALSQNPDWQKTLDAGVTPFEMLQDHDNV